MTNTGSKVNCPKCNEATVWKEGTLNVRWGRNKHHVGDVTFPHIWCDKCSEWVYPDQREKSAKRWGMAYHAFKSRKPNPATLKMIRYFSGFGDPIEFGRAIGINGCSYSCYENGTPLPMKKADAIGYGVLELVNKIKDIDDWPW